MKTYTKICKRAEYKCMQRCMTGLNIEKWKWGFVDETSSTNVYKDPQI